MAANWDAQGAGKGPRWQIRASGCWPSRPAELRAEAEGSGGAVGSQFLLIPTCAIMKDHETLFMQQP